MILTLFAPRARKHINALSYFELFEVPWEPKWCFSLNPTHFTGKSTFTPEFTSSTLLAIFTKNHPCPPIPARPGPGPAQDPGPGLARLRIPAPARDPGAGPGSRRWLGITAPARDPGAGSGSRRRLGIPAPARDPGAGSGSDGGCLSLAGDVHRSQEMLSTHGKC